MKKKEDIAQLIKQKLEGLSPATELPSWNAIEHTLAKRRKQRLAFWSIGTSLSLLLLIFLVFNYSNSIVENNSQDANTTNKQLSTGLDQVDDSFEVEGEAAKNLSTAPILDDSDAQNNKNQETKSAQKQINVTEFDSVDLLDGAQVKTTYYYYRDSDNTEVITQNKKVLDSLLNSTKTGNMSNEKSRTKAKDSL